MKNQYLKLCLVTHLNNQSLKDYQHFLRQVITGGVTMIQLRLKGQKPSDFYRFSREIKALVDPLGIPLIVNDDVSLAKKLDADGVHLGQSDMPPSEARKLLGPHKIIGWSIETLEQLVIANELNDIDYVAASAVFRSKTKTDCKTIWGIEGLKNIVKLSKHPVMAIGGIHLQNAKEVIETGVKGIAVVSALHDAQEPETMAQQLKNLYEERKI